MRRDHLPQDAARDGDDDVVGWPVDVLGETPKRYRVRTRRKTCLPSRGWVEKGTIVLVPKAAVTLVDAWGAT